MQSLKLKSLKYSAYYNILGKYMSHIQDNTDSEVRFYTYDEISAKFLSARLMIEHLIITVKNDCIRREADENL